MATASDHVKHHLAAMNDWIEGRRSWTNLGSPDGPITFEMIAVMDAQEVVKHAAAVFAYASLVGQGHELPEPEGRVSPDAD